MNVETENVAPNPSRTIEALRETGYDFETAIADIVDNSIVAEADVIDIDVEMDLKGNIVVFITDDGEGMSRGELINAMRYGAESSPDPRSLSKFGMGLKTASTAFCRELSVISRSSGDSDINKATWDLDYVAEVGEWSVKFPDPEEDEIEHLEDIAEDQSGTVVIWRKVDRLLKTYEDPGGKYAQNALEKEVDNLRHHLAMTFQRYLNPNDDRATDITIIVNGQEVEPWNPFCPEYSEIVAKKTVPVSFDESDEPDAEFNVKAYVLPRQDEFPDDESADEARISNDNQGFYVYRENRMICGPTWLRMFSKESHGSLLRVDLSFDHTLDEAFDIDLKKSKISLKERIYDFLKDFLKTPRRAADDRYRKERDEKIQKSSEGVHESSNKNIEDKEKDIEQPDVEVVDEEKGEVEVSNPSGKTRMKLELSDDKNPDEIFVKPVDSIKDGMLWEPTIIDQNPSVRINTGHQYYRKVYVPNHNSGVTIEGMDSLLWSLCVAEFNTVNDDLAGTFEEMRFEISRVLRKLVEDLPEPKDEDLDGE